MNAKLQAAALGLEVQAAAPYDRRAYLSEAGRPYAGTLVTLGFLFDGVFRSF
jgi:hypothetical protein